MSATDSKVLAKLDALNSRLFADYSNASPFGGAVRPNRITLGLERFRCGGSGRTVTRLVQFTLPVCFCRSRV